MADPKDWSDLTGNDTASTVGPNDINQLDDSLLDSLNTIAYQSSGAGNITAQYQTILSRFDRYRYNTILPNHELVGVTLFTRPKLNLCTTSLRQDTVMSTLDTMDPQTMQFAIRCYLDTKFASQPEVKAKAAICPFFNDLTPFIVPMTNCFVSLSGLPDYNVDSVTTRGGFYSEDQTFVAGSDRNNKSYDLQLTFRDIQGGFMFALFFYWVKFMDLVTRGEVIAYPEDIFARRICYTTSIYRFIVDPSRRYITKWCKATGCYPTSIPTGAIFNVGENESFVHGAAHLNIPFRCNKVEYMEPMALRDFNAIVEYFASGAVGQDALSQFQVSDSTDPAANFTGIPYINMADGLNELQYLIDPQEASNNLQSSLSSLVSNTAKLVNGTSSLLSTIGV